MTDEEQRVASLVRAAFAGVTLGGGIGLRQANGIDDYADDATLAAYRAQDEKADWSAIPVEDLDRYYCSLAYFDAEGMRFHLPAYLIADLHRSLLTVGILSHLMVSSGRENAPFGLLSDAQRAAVREFLWLRLTDNEYEFDHPRIEDALLEYWGLPAGS